MKRSALALLCALTLAAMLGLAACSSSDAATDDASSAAPAAVADDASFTATDTAAATQSQDAEQGLYTIGDMCICNIYEIDGAPVADLAFQIQNVGDNSFDVHGTYLCLVDGAGNQVAIAEDSTVLVAPEILRPGDIAFVYTTSPVPLPEGMSADGQYQAGGEVYLTALDGEVVQYPVTDIQFVDQGGLPSITGTVTNNTDVAAEPVQITVIFLDNEDELIGVTSEIVPSIAAGESYTFTTSTHTLPAGCTTAICAGYDVMAVGYNA